MERTFLSLSLSFFHLLHSILPWTRISTRTLANIECSLDYYYIRMKIMIMTIVHFMLFIIKIELFLLVTNNRYQIDPLAQKKDNKRMRKKKLNTFFQKLSLLIHYYYYNGIRIFMIMIIIIFILIIFAKVKC